MCSPFTIRDVYINYLRFVSYAFPRPPSFQDSSPQKRPQNKNVWGN